MSVSDLDFERKKRTNDNLELTPRDLLRLALGDLDKGDYPRPRKCLILIVDEDDEKRLRLNPYRSGMTRTEEVAFLEIWKSERIDAWKA